MSIDPSAAPRRRRSSKRIFIPTLLLLVVAGGWSVFWWYAERKAEQVWNEVVARQAEHGVVIACKDRVFGGYPFRFEVRCAGPSVEVTREDHKATVTAGAFRLVAQIYQPNKLIAEADGPLLVTNVDNGNTVEATWKSAQASLSVWTDGPQDVRLVVDGLDATATLAGERRPLVQTAQLEAYARRSAAANAAPGSFDLNSVLTSQALPEVDKVLGDASPVKLSFDGLVTGLTDWRPKPGPVFLRDWAVAGGILHMEAARLDRGPTSLVAAGDLSADEEGRLSGKDLTVTISGVKELGETIKRSGIAPANVASFLNVGLAFAGKPANIDGKPAVEVPLTLSKGKVGVGGFALVSLPRLFEAD